MRHLLRGAIVALPLALSGCGLFGGGSDRPQDMTSAIAVNGFLWRASLDTISFMPLVEVDASTGTIITDWYTDPAVPDERMKVSVFILDKALRADALRVSVVRQKLDGGNWQNAPVQAGTELKIEDAILSRAREIRIETVDS